MQENNSLTFDISPSSLLKYLPMKRKKILFLCALVMLPLLVYLPTLKHELIWDSKPMIMENNLLKGEFSLRAPFRIGYWTSTSQKNSGYDYYRPLMVLSFMMEKVVWGLNPFRLRLVNLLIFVAALFVLYFFLCRQTLIPGIAETAILLFALFPLNLDNITWVVGRCDLLMLFFGLLALYLFDLFLDRRAFLIGLSSVASYLLALFSKEAALFFLPLFLLHELSRRKRLSYPLHAIYLIVTVSYWGVKSAVIGRSNIPIHFFPSLWENGRALLGVLGYYFRSLIFPFRYDMFLPVDAVETLFYTISGFLFLFLMVLLLWLGRKKIQYLQAWIWIAPFMAGYLLMIFTPIYPFSISTRYLLLPVIGCVWLLSHYLHALPKPRGILILVMLLFTFAATIIGNSQKYQSEINFWASACKSCPNDSFFLSKYAGQLREEGDFIHSEILLRRALTFRMKSSIAVAIALQLADIACGQARYAVSLDWLEKIRFLPLDLLQTNRRLRQLLKIHQARGDLAEAEAIIRAMALNSPTEQNKKLRIELYLAFAAWGKAKGAALALKLPEAGDWTARIEKMQTVFQSMPPKGQAIYFVNHGNFAWAWRLWPKEIFVGFAEQIQLARLAFLAGQEEEGKRRIENLAQKAGTDFRVFNSLGNLFFDLQRADEALPFYQRSLRLNPKQPALLERVKLTDWKNIPVLLK
jgi:tetratricopeptide (TPR) repeat protein